MSSADKNTSPQNEKAKVVLPPPRANVVLPPVPGSQPKPETSASAEAAKPVEAPKPAEKPVVLEAAAKAPEAPMSKPKVSLSVGSTGIDSAKPLTIGRPVASSLAAQSKPIASFDEEDAVSIPGLAIDCLAAVAACAFAVLIFIQL